MEKKKAVTKPIGLSYIEARKTWLAQSIINGALCYLGHYDVKDDAARAVDMA